MDITKEDMELLKESLKTHNIQKIERPSMDETYLKMAKALAERSACLRRGYGAVAVNPETNEVIALGYNGGARKGDNCCEIGYCVREELHIPAGQRYEYCRGTIHAEMNVCQSAKGSDLKGSTLYLYGLNKKTGEPVEEVNPCSLCSNMLKNVFVKELKCWKGGKIISKRLDNIYMCGRKGVYCD